MKEYFHHWYSQYLGKEIEMLVFGHEGYPVILFPTEQGKYYDAKDFGIIQSAEELIYNGKIKIYCPESFDSFCWYNYHISPPERVQNYLKVEEMVLKDVLEFAKFDSGYDKVALAGLSFGAYTAMNIAFKYPEKIGYLICVGGMLDIHRFILGHYDDECYYNNPSDYLPGLNDEKLLSAIKAIGIAIGIGNNDDFLFENLRISRILLEKNINHWLDVREGFGHDWHWWKEMFANYLSFIK
ncbi:MAG: alpha/beta hydrolase-fold protein [bacterium]